MSIRLNCRACRTAFLTADDRLGLTVACPKCGAEQAVPATVAAEAPGAPAETTWVPPPEVPPDDEAPRRRRARPILLAGLVLLPVLAVAALVAWPGLRGRWRPTPPDPALVAAEAYLQALVDGDEEAARALATVDDPPAIRSFGRARPDPTRRESLRGSFAPIGRLNERISERFEYDPEIGRFKARNPLGPAAETLDALHEAKAQAERDKIYEKMASGDPEDLFDAAEGLAKAYMPLAALAEGALKPAKLVPTYARLVREAEPPLPPAEEALALDYGDDRETWDALLKRPFPTLKADGPFVLDRIELTSPVRDKLASSGDPPSTLRLTLTRFRLEGIDTGWKVTSARRDVPGGGPPAGPIPPTRPERRSPGDASP